MKKRITQVTLLSIVANLGMAQDFYIVKPGDTFSHIVKLIYPNAKLYGPQGKLAEIKQNNSHIKNVNRIFPKQKIYFAPVSVIETASNAQVEASPVMPLENQEGRKVSEISGRENWNLSALYGAKFLSISQSGVLGKAELGVLFLNNLKLNSEFLFDDWSFGFQFDSYRFKYEALSSGDSKQMYTVNLYGSYKWFLGGLNIEQSPFFKNDNGNIEMAKMTVMNLSLGAKKDLELPTRKPTTLQLKGWVNYPLSSSSDNANLKLDSVKGLGVMGQAELNRQIFTRKDYSLHATWMTQLGMQKMSQDVEWGASKGEVKSTITQASTAIGMQLKF